MFEYSAFASVYDAFMDNVDYDKWSARIAELLEGFGIKDGLVLDLGCGTGQITQRLSEKGYDMTGIDSSADMLQIASSKKDASGEDILYLLQDMREFELYGTMRAIVSTCDCINYIIDEEELTEVFRLVNNYLDPGGIFIFDFNTKKKYSRIGNQTIAENRDIGSFIWENYYSEEDAVNEYQLTLFLPAEKGLYEKQEEYHIQKGYELEEIKDMLERAGMEFIAAYNGYNDIIADENSGRILVAAREKGKN